MGCITSRPKRVTLPAASWDGMCRVVASMQANLDVIVRNNGPHRRIYDWIGLHAAEFWVKSWNVHWEVYKIDSRGQRVHEIEPTTGHGASAECLRDAVTELLRLRANYLVKLESALKSKEVA